VIGFSNAQYKSFPTQSEAEAFLSAPRRSLRSLSPVRKIKDLPPAQAITVDTTAEPLTTETSEAALPSNIEIVWTDGACRCNGQVGAVAGIGVFFSPGDPRNLSEPLASQPTNQRAEITAAIRALHLAKNGPVQIRTDSKYLVSAMTQWIIRWKHSGWSQEIKNKDLFMELDALVQQRPLVQWIHVPGHAGVYGNIQADALAVRACSYQEASND